MKLAKFVGAAIAFSAISLSAVSVFAADDSFTIGSEIYDITDGKYVSNLEEGHEIAVPVDITSTTGSVTSFKLAVKYDASVLSGGIAVQSPVGANIKKLEGARIKDQNDSSKWGAIKNMELDEVQVGIGNVNTTYTSTTEASAKCVAMNFTNSEAVPVAESAPEAYLLFTVVGKGTELNKTVITVLDAECSLADVDNEKSIVKNIPGTSNAKANACAGAIKINIDSNALKDAGLYLHGLQVKVGSGSAVNVLDLIDNGDGTYSFPIRFINDSNAPITTLTGVKLIAKVAETETADTYEEKTSTLEDIALNAPTDYANTSATIS